MNSIVQSWGVISGAADAARAARAMAAVDKIFIFARRDDGLALLFTAPFDQTTLDPGYIKGYPQGFVRMAAIYSCRHWSVPAFAKLAMG